MIDLSIVVPTLNRLNSLEVCLDSIRACTNVPHEVIVYANECSDEMTSFLDDRPEVRSIRDPENRFFTEAVNRGIAEARGRYVFLMNDDCRVLQPNWSSFYIGLLEMDESIGVVGPHLLNLEELPLGWIEPYAAMYRRSLFDDLGPLPYFDSTFCLWWSDIYHAYRLMTNGYYLFPLERSLADGIVGHARGINEYGATVTAMRALLPRACFEFHGKGLMYERLGIDSDADLIGYYGGQIWQREDVQALVPLPGNGL